MKVGDRVRFISTTTASKQFDGSTGTVLEELDDDFRVKFDPDCKLGQYENPVWTCSAGYLALICKQQELFTGTGP